jgi:hypothetical protein
MDQKNQNRPIKKSKIGKISMLKCLFEIFKTFIKFNIFSLIN